MAVWKYRKVRQCSRCQMDEIGYNLSRASRDWLASLRVGYQVFSSSQVAVIMCPLFSADSGYWE